MRGISKGELVGLLATLILLVAIACCVVGWNAHSNRIAPGEISDASSPYDSILLHNKQFEATIDSIKQTKTIIKKKTKTRRHEADRNNRMPADTII